MRSKYRDPLHILLDYIAKRAPGCDMAVVHDDDLERILGVGDGSSLETLMETLQPDVVTDHLERSQLMVQKKKRKKKKRSQLKIDSLPRGQSPTEHVRVAMLSEQVKSSNHLSLVLLLSRFVASGFFPPPSQPPLQPTPWQTHLIGGDANTRPLRTAPLGKWLASWSPFRYDVPSTMGQSSSPRPIPLALPTTSPPVRTGPPQEWLRRDTLRPSFDYGVRSGSALGQSSFSHSMPQILQTCFGDSPNAAGQLQPRDRWDSLTGIDFKNSATSLTASTPSDRATIDLATIDRALRCAHSGLYVERRDNRVEVTLEAPYRPRARFGAADDGECYAYNFLRAYPPSLRWASSVSPGYHDDQQSLQQRRTEGMRDVAFGLEMTHAARGSGDTTTSGPLRLT
ncbi:hypothetical protein EDB83DRAFT_2431738 [Lactarius deliciosus]|nr:hypothetical protein EDB83DRAFT_2431738 [Lactarius deliciosus]